MYAPSQQQLIEFERKITDDNLKLSLWLDKSFGKTPTALQLVHQLERLIPGICRTAIKQGIASVAPFYKLDLRATGASDRFFLQSIPYIIQIYQFDRKLCVKIRTIDR